MNEYASIFISDLHLGSPYCKWQSVLQVLQSNSFDKLYLVGDIFDFWHIKRNKGALPREHLRVLAALLDKAQRSELYYLTGNHDKSMLKYVKQNLYGVYISESLIHEAQDGKSYLITHGDSYDRLLKVLPCLEQFGSWFYAKTFSILKLKSSSRKSNYLDNFLIFWAEILNKCLGDAVKDMLRDVQSLDLAGVICGHTHQAGLWQNKQGLIYANCGDWLGAGSYIVEQVHGELELIHCASLEPNLQEYSKEKVLENLTLCLNIRRFVSNLAI